MTTAPRFSVIVPAFNAARTLLPCIGSALRQTLGDLEVVVVDDGSTDATRSLAESVVVVDPRVRVVHQSNRGVSATRNAGIGVARGDLICFLDSDDLWLPTYLEAVATAFDRRPDAALAYTDAWVLDDRTRRIRKRTAMQRERPPASAPSSAAQLFRELLRRNFIYSSAVARVDALKTVGLFDETLTAAVDWELWLRMSASGYVAVSVAGPLALYRYHPGQISDNPLRLVQNQVAVLEKVVSDYPLSPGDREVAERTLAHVHRELEIVQGTRRWRAFGRRQLHRASTLRQRIAAGHDSLARPPEPVARAFPDLSRV